MVETILPLLVLVFCLWASKLFQISRSPQILPPLSKINARILSNLGLKYYSENSGPITSFIFFLGALASASEFLFGLMP